MERVKFMTNLDLLQADFTGFGYRELDMAGALLNAIAKDGIPQELELSLPIKIAFNANSGNVFLTDEEFNVVMENENGEMENWLFCGECGHEDFKSEFTKGENENETFCPECKKIL